MTTDEKVNPAAAGQAPRKPQLYMASVVLLAAGLLLATTTNLAKLAHSIGISPLAYLTWSLSGALLLLTAAACYRKQKAGVNRRTLEYYIVSGFLTVAGTNLIFFSAVSRLSVSFVALMLSLPPLLTYVGALLLRMERFCWWRVSGVMLALAGTALLVAQNWKAPNTDPVWIAVTLIGPVLLAAGNLYRTRRWPPAASAESLAPGMLAGAIAILALFSAVSGWSLKIPIGSKLVVALIAVQAIIFAGQFTLLFVLQKMGGPVFLSQMGGISAIFGVPIAMVLLAEPVLPGFAASAALIALGIVAMLLGATACRQYNTRSHRIANQGSGLT